MRTRSSIAAFLSFWLCACSSDERTVDVENGPTRVRAAGRTTLALVSEEQPLITAQIEGGSGESHAAVLLVDTGAAFSWLDDDFVARNGFEREPLGATVVDINGVEGAIAERTRIERLRLGRVEVTGWKAPILHSLWEGVDGTIGQDFLRTLLVVFDGPGRRLILDAKSAWPELRSELAQGTAYAYDLDWSDGVPKVDLPVADTGRTETFWIDTGVSRMLLPAELVDLLGFQRVGRLDSQGLAGSTLDAAIVDVPRLTLQDVWFQGQAQEGTHCALGWGVLREAVLVLDNASDRMLLVVGASWKEE